MSQTAELGTASQLAQQAQQLRELSSRLEAIEASQTSKASGDGADASQGSPVEDNVSSTSLPHIHNEYCVEENIYGLSYALPQCKVYCVFMVFYIVVLTTTGVITLAVWTASQSAGEDMSALCTTEGNSFDCRPPGFSTLQDFSALDTNQDGVWSLSEAREQNLLLVFQRLLQFGVFNSNVLTALFPYQPARPNILCYFGTLHSGTMGNGLTAAEKIEMFNVSGYITDEFLESYTACVQSDDYAEYQFDICVDDSAQCKCSFYAVCGPDDGQWQTVEDAPARTSADQYMEATLYMSQISNYLYDELVANLLPPCRLVNPDLCPNAEVQGVIQGVPMWRELNPEDRIQACILLVQSECPILFGQEYTRFRVESTAFCGEPRYEAVKVWPTSSHLPVSNRSCEDNDLDARDVVGRILLANPAMSYVFMAFETVSSLPRGTISQSLTCALGQQLNLCTETNPIISPYDNSTVSPSVLFGQVCPETCCSPQTAGCPSYCASPADVTNVSFGYAFCIGDICPSFTLQGVGETLRIQRESFSEIAESEQATLVIKANLALTMNFISMGVGDPSDTFCNSAYFSVNGVKYCAGNHPQSVDIPSVAGGQLDILWYYGSGWDYCSQVADCSLYVTILESGEPDAYTVSEVDFEQVAKYTDDQDGIMTIAFGGFFYVVLLLWGWFVAIEWKTALQFWGAVRNAVHWSVLHRSLITIFICVPRLVIAIWVYAVGVILLISSTGYIEIVLNSVALAFVLEFDEYLFNIVATHQQKRYIMDKDPVKWTNQLPAGVSVVLVFVVPVALSVAITYAQYNWANGYEVLAAGAQCLCGLHGDSCRDATL